VNQNSNNVSAFAITPATGVLTPISAIASGTGPISVFADPLGLYLYVANETSNNVSAFAINQTTGALTLAPGSPFSIALSTTPRSIAVDLSGRFAYVANDSGTVTAFTINQTSGALSPAAAGSSFAAGLNPSAITTVGRF
jgi:6-phosphogluconolactonase